MTDLTLGSDDESALQRALNAISDEQWKRFETRVGLILYHKFHQSAEESQKAAGDLVNNAVRKALEAKNKFDPEKGNVLGWLWRFVEFEIMHLKRDGYYVGDVFRDKQFVSPVSEEPDEEPDIFVKLGIFSSSSEEQALMEVNELIAQTLRPEEQEFLKLYSSGFASDELAAHFSLNTGAVYTRLSRIRKKLQAALSEIEKN